MATTFPTIPAGRARFAGALRSEWTKLRTIRSTRWLLLVLVVATVAIGIGVSAAEATGIAHQSAARKAAFDPADWSLSVLGFTQFFFGILGVLAISGEYTSGTIRSSLAAVPRRLRLLAAKTAVLGLAALLAGQAVTFAMFFSGQALLASAGAPHTSLGQPGVARAIAATGIFLALLALLGLGCGTVFRRSAGGIAAYVTARPADGPCYRVSSDVARDHRPAGPLRHRAAHTHDPGPPPEHRLGLGRGVDDRGEHADDDAQLRDRRCGPEIRSARAAVRVSSSDWPAPVRARPAAPR